MKTIANRMIVIAASVIALGTTAFGQNRMTAEIPFSFRTASGTLPAGTYEFNRAPSAVPGHSIIIRNVATDKSVFAGNALYNAWSKATDAPVAVFLCGSDGCALRALKTRDGSTEYNVPKSKDHEKMAEIKVPMRPRSTD